MCPPIKKAPLGCFFYWRIYLAAEPSADKEKREKNFFPWEKEGLAERAELANTRVPMCPEERRQATILGPAFFLPKNISVW
jgi:hypothetical protein